MSLRQRRAGFSLLEVVIAAALLLTTCVGVSGVLAAALRAESRLRGRDVRLAAIDSELARLEALPFAPGRLPLGGVPDDTGAVLRGSLVGEVFPHADASRNGPLAYYCADAGWGEPGTFVTTLALPWGEVRRVVRFVVWRVDHWEAPPLDTLRNWSLWASRELPGAALRIDLIAVAAAGDRTSVTRSVVLQALPVRREGTP